MLRSSLCALLAPALASAMAFPWDGPAPTGAMVLPQIDLAPMPTSPPKVNARELFELAKRTIGDNTCGYISGSEFSSLTCNNPDYVCATNTYYSAHGCCDPSSIASCTIPAYCVPSSLMSVSCTDSSCLTDSLTAKCTDIDSPYCYEWLYVYSGRTTMTEHGCNSVAFTIAVSRTFDGDSSATSSSDPVIPISTRVVTYVPSDTSTGQTTIDSTIIPTSTSTGSVLPITKKKKSTPVGAIVGGVVGGLVLIGAIIFGVIFAMLRKKKANRAAAAAAAPPPGGMAQGPAPGVAEYKPQPGGFPQAQGYAPPPQQGGYYQQDVKPGFNQQPQMGVPGQEVGGMSNAPYSPPMSPAPQYQPPFNNHAPPPGVAEAGGNPIQPAPQQQHPPQHQVYEAP